MFAGKRALWLVGGFLVAAGILLIVFGGGRGNGEGDFQADAAPVVVEPVSPYLFADIIEAIGTARANESVTVTAQISDTVKKVHFEDGAKVDEGTILVTLTNAEELANVSAAVASYTEAKQKYDRTKPLVDKGTLSQAGLDAATRELEEARARLNAARARAGDYVITAPFSGYLGLREVSPGTLVSPGTEVTTLDDISIIKLDFSVPERFLLSLAPGQEIVAEAAAFGGQEFRGIIKTISTRVDPVTRALTVRAEIPNPDDILRPGMLMTVDLVSRVTERLSVLQNALIPVGEDQFVFVVGPDNLATRTQIVIGRRYNQRVEVLSGLEAGDLVVASGTLRLRPGSAVSIQREIEPPKLPEFLLSFIEQELEIETKPEETDTDDSF